MLNLERQFEIETSYEWMGWRKGNSKQVISILGILHCMISTGTIHSQENEPFSSQNEPSQARTYIRARLQRKGRFLLFRSIIMIHFLLHQYSHGTCNIILKLVQFSRYDQRFILFENIRLFLQLRDFLLLLHGITS